MDHSAQVLDVELDSILEEVHKFENPPRLDSRGVSANLDSLIAEAGLATPRVAPVDAGRPVLTPGDNSVKEDPPIAAECEKSSGEQRGAITGRWGHLRAARMMTDQMVNTLTDDSGCVCYYCILLMSARFGAVQYSCIKIHL